VSNTLSQGGIGAAATACTAVLDRIEQGQANGEFGPHVDDRSICIVVFKRLGQF
jgi:hypothetical protein